MELAPSWGLPGDIMLIFRKLLKTKLFRRAFNVGVCLCVCVYTHTERSGERSENNFYGVNSIEKRDLLLSQHGRVCNVHGRKEYVWETEEGGQESKRGLQAWMAYFMPGTVSPCRMLVFYTGLTFVPIINTGMSKIISSTSCLSLSSNFRTVNFSLASMISESAEQKRNI